MGEMLFSSSHQNKTERMFCCVGIKSSAYMSNEYRTVKSDIVAESEIMFDKYVNNSNNLTFTYRMIHHLVKVGKKSKLN